MKISGFGTFTLRDKGERLGRNPKTAGAGSALPWASTVRSGRASSMPTSRPAMSGQVPGQLPARQRAQSSVSSRVRAMTASGHLGRLISAPRNGRPHLTTAAKRVRSSTKTPNRRLYQRKSAHGGHQNRPNFLAPRSALTSAILRRSEPITVCKRLNCRYNFLPYPLNNSLYPSSSSFAVRLLRS